LAARALDSACGPLPPALLEQIMALVRAANGASPAVERVVAAAVNAGGLTAGPDPRAVLPLDRDERGYGGF
jgi:hypothetical protein